MHENEILGIILDAAMKVHQTLGLGLFESVYEVVFFNKLRRHGICAEHQMALPIIDGDVHPGEDFRTDLVVEGKVMVELKSIMQVASLHKN